MLSLPSVGLSSLLQPNLLTEKNVSNPFRPSSTDPVWYSLTILSPFASNKSQGPNFSPPSITLSDVGPDPGLSSTGQDKTTLHLVFCGCRVLMLVGPDPRSSFALFLFLSSSLSSFFAFPPEPKPSYLHSGAFRQTGRANREPRLPSQQCADTVQPLGSVIHPFSGTANRLLQLRIGPVELSAASYTYLPATPHHPPSPCLLLPFTIPVPRSGRTPNTAHPPTPTPTPIRHWPDPTANVYSHITISSVSHARRQHSRRHSVSNLNRPADRSSRFLGAPIRLSSLVPTSTRIFPAHFYSRRHTWPLRSIKQKPALCLSPTTIRPCLNRAPSTSGLDSEKGKGTRRLCSVTRIV
ncbi:hypothetical protein BDP81DRAFT_69763 [Colletotrichum phormii]|uniref:Uncharacterized protein n=1 Tax=Colletotrichum phormii TaxID=359342 RepID=A0AAI9ZKK1_9PEZI|nr:uncharacterized protein BDP81DRAFT_69763 [Colletotrichum phormii]KAK1633687.1 hypothetical protein BDP81DRAFT_69763 [Colletotrichum phormii]